MKRSFRFLDSALRASLGMTMIFLAFAGSVFAEDDAFSAEDKAKEIHRLASSDVIYQDQETKAIYYQNVQIIELLKQIRDILDSRLKQEEANES